MIRRDGRLRGSPALLVVCSLAWAAACAEDEATEVEQRTAREPARVESAAAEPAPPSGPFEIAVRNGRASVSGAGVSRRAVLKELADRAGFKLSIRKLVDAPVDLDFRDASFADVLAALLAGDPYDLDYRVDEASGQTRLFRVRVGPSRLFAAREGANERTAGSDRRRRERRGGGMRLLRRIMNPEGAEVRARRREQVIARMEARAEAQDELIGQLEEPDPAARIAALEQLEIEGAGLDWAAYLAETDPSVAVRRTAVERLGNEGSYGAMSGVLVALDDPSPEVVIEALQAIDRRGDASLLPHVRPLLEHADPKVRATAQNAVRFLE